MKNRNRLLSCIVGLCMSLHFIPCMAADHPVHFKRLTVDEGLSHNTVLALTQDHNGKIWVGTIDGLNWFDGSRFAPFYKSQNDSISIGNNRIYSLYTDNKGTVWAGTLVGLSRYNIVGNNFTNFSLPDNSSMQVFAIDELEERDQLLLATNVGLVTFDKPTGKMKLIPQLQGRKVYDICRMNDGVLLGTSAGVFFYYTRNGNVTQLLPQLKNEAIADIIYDYKTKDCWIASLNNGIYCIDDKYQIRKHYNKQNTGGQILSNTVRTLGQDDQGKIWIGTMEGLLILEPSTESFERYTFSHEDPTSLGHNSIRAILKDNQGGMWLGAYYGGLNYYHPLAPSFGILRHSAFHNSLSDNTVSCIVEEQGTGNLWIGTNDGGVNYYDRKKDHFTSYRVADNVLKSNNIKCVFPDKDGNVFIGTHGGGMSCLNSKSGRVETYSISATSSLANSCYALLDGGDGTLWVGTMGGLYRFDKQSRQLELHPLAKKQSKLKDVLINTLYRDSKGRVWIGTEESLFIFANGQMEELVDTSQKHSRGLIQAFCIQEDMHHNTWIGSSSGLYRYQQGVKMSSWEHYSMQSGLPNDCVFGILEDEQGRFWLTTSNGLTCFNPKEKTFRNYTKQDGLPHSQFNQYGACKASDGTFFLGTLGGVTYFHPYNFASNPYAPNPVIAGASVQNQPVIKPKNGLVDFYQDERGKLLGMSFPSNQKLFNIRFSVINYLSGKRNMFAYKLEGFDTDWTYSTQLMSIRGATYSNLPYGDYVFKVKACNDNGQWSETATEFFVRILPMWYQTWWAKTLFTLLAMSLLVFIVYFYIARAKMQMQMQIEHIERNKIEEISREKVRFYINMSHELRTPLSLILAPLEELLGEKNTFEATVRQKLSYVYRNGQKLLHIVNQLLDFRKAESGTLPIHVAQASIEELAMNVFNLFRENAQKRNIFFRFQSELKGELFPVDKMYLETILMNLLSNAFKFTPDGGEISLTMWKKATTYGFTVKDSGVGVPAEKLTRIFEPFYQVDDHRKGSGIGLALVKSLVDKHRGTIVVNSEPGKFTEFMVALPVDIGQFTEEERTQREEPSNLRETVLEEEFSGEIVDVASETEENEEVTGLGEEGKSTILLVDDNKEMIDYLKGNFKSKYITLTAGNGEEALAIMKEQKVDVVLSDVMMPVMDGLKLCEIIKKNMQTCHIPVILLSAKGSIEAQTAGIQGGADDYIPKPFSMSILKGKINNILKAKQRLRYYYSNTIDIDVAKMTSNSLDEEFITKAIQAVEDNIDDEGFTADDLADKLFMSRSSLYLKMNSVSGEPPANFIRRIRFNKACKLLLEGRYTVSEVSARVGFSSPSYFSTSFKKHMGCLPSDYVKKQGKSVELN